MELIVGFKTHSHRSEPHLIYLGRDRSKRNEALAKAAGKGFVRVGAVKNPQLVKLKLNSTPESIAAAEAEEREQRAAEAEAQRQAEGAQADQRELVQLRSEVMELRGSLSDANGTIDRLRLQLQQAEAEKELAEKRRISAEFEASESPSETAPEAHKPRGGKGK